MSYLTYDLPDIPLYKPLVWLSGEVKSPPLGKAARIEVGYLLRCLQAGVALAMPHSRPMTGIGSRCHELRINDVDATWRIIYRADEDAVVILEVFQKKTDATPRVVIENCRQRLRRYDQAAGEVR